MPAHENNRSFTLSPLPEEFAIRKLPADAAVPVWATQGSFSSVTRTADELSIIVESKFLPPPHQAGELWRMLKVHGPFEPSSIGVIASLVAPLAAAQLSVFTVSTFDTDYLLIQVHNFQRAQEALRQAGHSIHALETVP
jgi:uncharacterized protein